MVVRRDAEESRVEAALAGAEDAGQRGTQRPGRPQAPPRASAAAAVAPSRRDGPVVLPWWPRDPPAWCSCSRVIPCP